MKIFKLDKFKLFIFLFFLCTTNLYAQNFQILQTHYYINGTTKKIHLENKVKINYKKVFTSEKELTSYLELIKKQYINLRLFDDIQIEYFVLPTQNQQNTDTQNSEQNSEKITKVFLQIKIIDSKSFIILPYYKYDAKDGNVVKVKLKNSNFCGTLNPLESELSFGIKQKNENSNLAFTFGGAFNYNLPFYFGPIQASWNNILSTSYTLTEDMPEWNISTGFTFKLPFEKINFILDLQQQFVNNFDYKIYNDQMYFSEKIDFSIPIQIYSIKNFSDIIYTPSINYTYNWKTNNKINIINDDLLSPELLVSNKFSTDNIYWNKNFRKGLSFFIKQDSGYNFLIDKYVIGFESEFTNFISNDKLGLSTRLYGFYYLNKNKKIANKIRGIQNDEYFTNPSSLLNINSSSTPSAIVLNIDLPILVFTTDFENTNFSKLKKFNFDFIVSPFIDIALCKNRSTNKVFAFEDGFYTAGLEFIVFPLKWKSMQIRASAGLDIGRLIFKDFIDTSWRPNLSIYEISFGMGLHY